MTAPEPTARQPRQGGRWYLADDGWTPADDPRVSVIDARIVAASLRRDARSVARLLRERRNAAAAAVREREEGRAAKESRRASHNAASETTKEMDRNEQLHQQES